MAAFLLNDKLQTVFTEIGERHGTVVRRKFIEEVLVSHQLEWENVKHLLEDTSIVTRPKRGSYGIQAILNKINGTEPEAPDESTAILPGEKSHKDINNEGGLRVITGVDCYVPSIDPNYIRWGNYSDLESIIQSQLFFPVYLSGDSGNGKTKLLQQVCANNARQYVRVQINEATDEDDLIGGLRLIDGETVFVEGPVISAMRAGAVLLIDEIDRGSDKTMCLQGILEGTPFLIKRTGQMVYPAAGFTIVATGNTDGRGDLSGRFNATIMDEAFLERFAILMVQKHPTEHIIRKITTRLAKSLMIADENFVEAINIWANKITTTRPDEMTPVVSIRRIELIMKSYSIFRNANKAIDYGIQRFDESVRLVYRGYWKTIYADVEAAITAAEAAKREEELKRKAADAAARATGQTT